MLQNHGAFPVSSYIRLSSILSLQVGLIFVVPEYMPSLISILKEGCIPCRNAKPTSLMHIGVEDPTAPGPNGGDPRLARACRMHFGCISRLWLKFRVFIGFGLVFRACDTCCKKTRNLICADFHLPRTRVTLTMAMLFNAPFTLHVCLREDKA